MCIGDSLETNVSPAENEQAVSSVWTWMQGNVGAATQTYETQVGPDE